MNWSVPCGGCQKTLTKASNAKKCAKCKSVWYCSKECQALDWKRPNKQGHKHRCAALAAADQTQGTGSTRTAKALTKPAMEDTRGVIARVNEILQPPVPPGTKKCEVRAANGEDRMQRGGRRVRRGA